MTNEDLKLEAIKKAYGVWYISQKINDLGWFIMEKPYLDKPIDNGFNEFDVDILAFAWRPKSLRGLETNNQWIRIEEDGSNLPKEYEFYNACHYDKKYEDVAIFYAQNLPELKILWSDGIITHFQPVIKIEPPLW